ncbi:DUF3152 domain-containing protein [Babesia caballi]|uniref:DUF3152 domain-containing protein n=1 Tax=Babesia caballi TaxID=5871 RepID=A0AAV4LNN2_BABCB|nr:DUF3152 domain-containing protein [Babesia caballi]
MFERVIDIMTTTETSEICRLKAHFNVAHVTGRMVFKMLKGCQIRILGNAEAGEAIGEESLEGEPDMATGRSSSASSSDDLGESALKRLEICSLNESYKGEKGNAPRK